MASVIFLNALLPANAASLQSVSARRPAVVSQLSPLGSLDRTQTLNLAIALPLRNKAALAQFLREVSDPQSPNYRHTFRRHNS
ncbi:MAG TPA: protease pro-enzyme activation domain-containing protein, partial [Nitrososphaera sp.]|nr:protease pro-enzyme activation domain-containing protein [Nitrososphaera sp.]